MAVIAPRLRRAAPFAIVVGALVLFVVLRLDRFLDFEHIVARREPLRQAVDDAPALALLAYVALYVTVTSLAIPGNLILNLAGGFLFGAAVGGIAGAGAATLGASFLFLAARTMLNDFLTRKAGGTIGRIREGVQRSAWSYMLSLRLSPMMPAWLVNIGAAVAGVPLPTFVWTTALGILPVTFVAAFGGANLDRLVASSAAGLAACRAAGEADCRAGLALRDVVSPPIVALLFAASALTLLPALVRGWRAGRAGNGTDVRDADI